MMLIPTGVFVDEAMSKSQTERELVVEKMRDAKKAVMHNLAELFREGDRDDSGQMTYFNSFTLWPQLRGGLGYGGPHHSAQIQS